MLEKATHPGADIPEEIMLGRLAQSDQMREFFIQMWLQNPILAKEVKGKVQDILSLGESRSAPSP